MDKVINEYQETNLGLSLLLLSSCESAVVQTKYTAAQVCGKAVMEAMRHASTFLRLPAPDISSPSYALVVLNQRLPRFAPLLWSHGELLTLPLSSPWDSVGVRIIYLFILCV